ncbi:MAG: hypothetical protein WA139_04135 [Candidatus Aenigmatarchaeota archaeon]
MSKNQIYYREQSVRLDESLDEFLEKYGSRMNFKEAESKLAEEGLFGVPKARYDSRVIHHRIKHKPVKQAQQHLQWS